MTLCFLKGTLVEPEEKGECRARFLCLKARIKGCSTIRPLELLKGKISFFLFCASIWHYVIVILQECIEWLENYSAVLEMSFCFLFEGREMQS